MASKYVGFLLAAWYLTAPIVWGYPMGFLWWHSAVLGGAILVVTVSFHVETNRLSGWGLIAVGLYSMLSPFLHSYLPNAQGLFNDLVFGVLTIGTGAAMGGAGIAHWEEKQAALG